MRNALATAALVGLLAVIPDMRQAAAQLGPAQPALPQMLAPTAAPQMLAPTAVPQTLAPERATRASVRKARASERTGGPDRSRKVAKAKAGTSSQQRSKVHRKRHARAAPERARSAPPNARKIAERDGYKPVSELVNFPKFFPGLGIIYVKPDTLPLGPFLCFDRSDRLVATVYMVPIKDIDDHKTMDAAGFKLSETAGFAGAVVDHVSFYFNPGHPGVDMPHYHVVIWHVPKSEEARVAK